MKNARQRLCRAFLALRRASETHGEGRVSRSDYISLTLHQLPLFPLALRVAGSIDPFLPLKHHQGMW
jgi:hypothetical protein